MSHDGNDLTESFVTWGGERERAHVRAGGEERERVVNEW